MDFLLAPGQAHELAPSVTLLNRLPQAPCWVLADMACDARTFRADVRGMGAIPVVPSRRGAKQPEPCPDYIYRHRNLIERCWSRLKERRAMATRHDKTAMSYAAGVAIWDALADRAAHYATRARGDGTRRTYRSAWAHFCAWCATLGREPLAGDPELVAMYVVRAPMTA